MVRPSRFDGGVPIPRTNCRPQSFPEMRRGRLQITETRADKLFSRFGAKKTCRRVVALRHVAVFIHLVDLLFDWERGGDGHLELDSPHGVRAQRNKCAMTL